MDRLKPYFLLTLIVIASQPGMVGAGPNKPVTSLNPGRETVEWYEQKVKKSAWRQEDELAVFPRRGKGAAINKGLLTQAVHSNARILRENNFVILLKSPEPIGKTALSVKLRSMKSLPDIRSACPVYSSGDSKERLIATGQIIVKFESYLSDGEILALEKGYGLERLNGYGFSKNAYLYGLADCLSSLEVAGQLAQSAQVVYAYPNWLREKVARAQPDDTLFVDQWHLDNTGQDGGTPGEDVNITPAWDLHRGSPAEVVVIVDDGLEISHEDLADNVLFNDNWDYVDGDLDPTGGDHGTSCAGVAAGVGFNQQGISGAAPSAGLVGYRLLGAETDANEADAFNRNLHLVDVYSNSWGPADDGTRLEGPGPLTEDALRNGVLTGRNGLGNIFVWAGGNGYDEDNSNYDGYANSRYTIAVAASTNQGKRAAYSEKGANILVNAPSSGGSKSISTTDRTGALGYSAGEYTGTFGGTSAAAPLVSGVIALMLQANPNLSWRDIQHILIETAAHNDPLDPDWGANGAGDLDNPKYGFGRVEAAAAVAAAAGWTPVDAEKTFESSSSPNRSIPDNEPNGVSDVIFVADDLEVEFVEVTLSASNHSNWGDLEITLRSPSGVESRLAEKHFSGNAATYDHWRFGSVRHFKEPSAGAWTLTVKDLWQADTGTFQSWTLKIYGTARNQKRRWTGPDFDLNLLTDLTIWRPASGMWFGKDNDTSSVFMQRWGTNGDIPFQGDFDGDGQTDVGVWRPGNGGWYVLLSSLAYNPASALIKRWGVDGDVPVPADYDGDGSTDLGIWRPSNGIWYIRDSDSGEIVQRRWGAAGDVPVPADYDGDGKFDLGIWRPTNGVWYIQSANGEAIAQIPYGVNGDVPIPADYDGDGMADLGIWRPASGTWFLKTLTGNHILVKRYGVNGDIPLTGDYDGDRVADISIWRPASGRWFILESSSAFADDAAANWGLNGDLPVASSPPSFVQEYLKNLGYY